MSRSPLSDDEAPQSGKNPKWTNSLTDWTADEMRTAFTQIQMAWAKECDVLRGCDEPVRWAVRFHDCHLYTACETHCRMIFGEVMSAIHSSRVFRCGECNQVFNLHYAAVRSWKI